MSKIVTNSFIYILGIGRTILVLIQISLKQQYIKIGIRRIFLLITCNNTYERLKNVFTICILLLSRIQSNLSLLYFKPNVVYLHSIEFLSKSFNKTAYRNSNGCCIVLLVFFHFVIQKLVQKKGGEGRVAEATSHMSSESSDHSKRVLKG